MPRLIDIEPLEKLREEEGAVVRIKVETERYLFERDTFTIPTIEAEPVRHGRWELGTVKPGYFTPGGNRPWICSECGHLASWMIDKPKDNYCPNCGAKMDGDENA